MFSETEGMILTSIIFWRKYYFRVLIFFLRKRSLSFHQRSGHFTPISLTLKYKYKNFSTEFHKRRIQLSAREPFYKR